jgi:hypothetical protein
MTIVSQQYNIAGNIFFIMSDKGIKYLFVLFCRLRCCFVYRINAVREQISMLVIGGAIVS